MAVKSRANQTLWSSEEALLSKALTAGSCKFACRSLEFSTFIVFVFITVTTKAGTQPGSSSLNFEPRSHPAKSQSAGSPHRGIVLPSRFESACAGIVSATLTRGYVSGCKLAYCALSATRYSRGLCPTYSAFSCTCRAAKPRFR